jgi:hypothetical protein
MECAWEKMAFKVRKALVEGIVKVCGMTSTSTSAEAASRPGDAGNVGSWLISGDDGKGKRRNRPRTYSSPISGPVTATAGAASASASASSSSGHKTSAAPPSPSLSTRTPSTSSSSSSASASISGAALSPQSAANLAYGISLLVFDGTDRAIQEELAPVHLALLDSISRIGVCVFSEPEKEQILIYIHTLQTLTHLDAEAVASHSPGCGMLRADKPYVRPSRLQQSVVSSLAAALKRRTIAELEVTNEYSAFDGAFPVDATIFEGDRPVAFVEVDGPQHYREDGLLRRKDLMKEALYRRKHPHASFTRVRFDQVNRLGSGFVGAQVANYVATVRTVRGWCCNSNGSGKTGSGKGSSTGFIGSGHGSGTGSGSGDDSKDRDRDCAECEEEGLAARRAQRELVMALSGRQARTSSFNDVWSSYPGPLSLMVASEPDNS